MNGAMIQMTLLPLDAARVAEKAAHMAEVDPHGIIITIVSVSVVFLALLVLFFCYSLVGKFCTGAVREWVRKVSGRKAAQPDEATAAAIAMALDMEIGAPDEETAAAIGLALDKYMNDFIHDNESYIITIRRKQQ